LIYDEHDYQMYQEVAKVHEDQKFIIIDDELVFKIGVLEI
jgi:hypothetical protein